MMVYALPARSPGLQCLSMFECLRIAVSIKLNSGVLGGGLEKVILSFKSFHMPWSCDKCVPHESEKDTFTLSV